MLQTQPRDLTAPFRQARLMRKCHEPSCAATFAAYKGDSRFHSPQCARKYHARVGARARSVYELLYAWRDYKKRYLLTDIAQHVRRWHEEDRAMRERAEKTDLAGIGA